MPKSAKPTGWPYLRRAMIRAGYTPASLAPAVDLSLSYTYQLLKGTRGPSIEVLQRLAEVLDVDPAELDRTKPSLRPRANPKPAPRRAGVSEAAREDVA